MYVVNNKDRKNNETSLRMPMNNNDDDNTNYNNITIMTLM